MSNVVSLAEARLERESHLSGEAVCLQCGHIHTAVVPCGTVDLECPACRTMKAVLRYGCEPETAWVCGCGCHLFMISGVSGEIICWVCGAYQKGFE